MLAILFFPRLEEGGNLELQGTPGFHSFDMFEQCLLTCYKTALNKYPVNANRCASFFLREWKFLLKLAYIMKKIYIKNRFPLLINWSQTKSCLCLIHLYKKISKIKKKLKNRFLKRRKNRRKKRKIEENKKSQKKRKQTKTRNKIGHSKIREKKRIPFLKWITPRSKWFLHE